MDKLFVWLNSSPLASFFRVFIALVMAQATNDFIRMGKFDFANWQTWFVVAIASAVPPVLRWLNPEDKAYGQGS